MKRPNSAANLIRAIKRYCGVNQDDIRLARAMADVIVGQMLPSGVVKGGSSLMFRYGGAVTRYTKDVDTARSVELEAYLESLRLKLAEGWNGFTGKIV
ncbi:MAG: nucleotidyl transferase AbiEii/AbiGii toxin family protein, partial [Kiritimatiellae bacterium]|nr:nucleotidyl transferase AbiEii/AbiGii toxin family protein [Kiritimatiellia bacterium]